MGEQITADYPEGPIYLIAILKGAFMFLADLSRAIKTPDAHRVHRHFQLRQRQDQLRRSEGDQGPGCFHRRPHVLMVEDIVDSGVTLNYLIKVLEQRGRNRCGSRRCWTSPSAGCVRSKWLRRVQDPGRVRGRLRAGLRGRLPQSARYLRL